ncbi:hypothetical protein [Maritalea myrionectae]|uniref:Uncharacterized protein n=1 Tax=Maritalea myrionectae TaxID=454601 RepID=A0A2R4MHJ9_9HYPH|nr:hypothetical protein [Maritalea myrionectae]AVX05393.1 hypothetical protein MXMO3_02883 [Maritalea myrionectae]
MSIICEEQKSDQATTPLNELLCKAHAIGFSEEEMAELRKLYGRGEEIKK